MTRKPFRTALAAGTAAVLMAAGAACSSNDDDGTVTLTVGLFGDFGFGPL